MRILRGRLRAIAASSVDCCIDEHVLIDHHGVVHEVYIPEGVNPPIDLPIIAYLERDRLEDWERLPGGPGLEAVPVDGRISVALVLITKNEPTDADWGKVRKRAKEMEWGLKGRLRHYYDISVTPLVFQSDKPVRVYGLIFNDIRREFSHLRGEGGITHWQAWGGSYQGFCGHGAVGGRESTVYLTWNCNHDGVHCHEILHNLRVGHSGRNGGTYGDLQCVQGSSQRRRGWIAYHYDYLNLIEDHYRIEIGRSQIVTLVPIEWGEMNTRDGEKMVAILPNAKGNLYFSTRAAEGHYTIWERNNDRLFIHQPTSNGSRNTQVVAEMGKGDIREFEGVEVRYLGVTDGAISVAFVVDGVEPESVTERSMVWLPPEPAVPVMKHNAGIWFEPALAGQGICLQVGGEHYERALAHLFSYDRNGNPYWLNAEGVIDKGIAHLMVHNQNKDVLGSAWLYLKDADHAIFKWEIDEWRRGGYDMELLMAHAHGGLSGTWYDPDRDGTGFSLHERVDGSVAAYYYGDHGEWLEMHGKRKGPEIIFEAYRYDGGGWLSPVEPKQSRIGIAGLNVNAMSMTLRGETWKLRKLL